MLVNVSDAIKDFLNGNRLTEEEISNRRKICEGCEFKAKFMLSYCKKCHCNLDGELGKISAPKEKCPIGLWSEKVKEDGK